MKYTLDQYEAKQEHEAKSVVERYELERESTLEQQAMVEALASGAVDGKERRARKDDDEWAGDDASLGEQGRRSAKTRLTPLSEALDGRGLYGRYPVRHGTGVHRYTNGSVYEGEWKDDKRDGRGKLVSASGEVYEGEWKADKRHGFGKHVYADGRAYVGPWRRGARHGLGKLVYVDGTAVRDRWVFGKRQYDESVMGEDEAVALDKHHRAVLAQGGRASGSRGDDEEGEQVAGAEIRGGLYTGEMRNGKRHGYGEWVSHSRLTGEVETVYRGEWVNDKREGRGYFRDAAIEYDGEWRAGKRHGKALVTTLSSGQRFKTVWRAGKRVAFKALDAPATPASKPRHSHGTRVFRTGAEYVGELELRSSPAR
ncbi:CMRP Flagellar component [Thecamonas trahens ATCC 50062]|uniref:CMRP Flagellar component n=1 Tax=Thecamonas trahens ATCC 50062 TaxID=461836 RepID=A0A0L0D6V3_THETB|nr:CMRP Flagellar component [Thecamonas trahens ATCC 50062]KNC48087.1 CMRP Flagellar component [Thecamonas trahens ATCC 50062]|eukprot:XP_013759100.1 CMRP Flagellar component [Thecamonas trahens ATCC 50062]